MNKEEFIGKLQMCYFGERNAFDEIVSEFDRLNNIINEFNKLLIEHIEEARYELNIILHSDNDLDYKNECVREFDILDKNIRMILDKLKEFKGEMNNAKD